MLHRIVLPLALILLVAGSVWADWVRVDSNEDSYVYIDPTSIRKNGDKSYVWIINDLKKRNDLGYLSARVKQEYDCKNELARNVYIRTFADSMAKGKVLGEYTYPNEGSWGFVPPQTMASTVLKIVCAK